MNTNTSSSSHATLDQDGMAKRIKRLEIEVEQLVTAARQVLSDIDDDGVAERDDMGVLALRNAVSSVQSTELACSF
jgi:hypothetical protein